MWRDMRKRYSDCVQLLYDAFGGRFASGSRADTTCCDPGSRAPAPGNWMCPLGPSTARVMARRSDILGSAFLVILGH